MLDDLRDIIIIIGITSSLVLLIISTSLIISVFLKIRRLARFIENSVEEISDIRNKVKKTIPKPISNLIDGAVTLKTVIDKMFTSDKKGKRKKERKENKNGK